MTDKKLSKGELTASNTDTLLKYFQNKKLIGFIRKSNTIKLIFTDGDTLALNCSTFWLQSKKETIKELEENALLIKKNILELEGVASLIEEIE